MTARGCLAAFVSLVGLAVAAGGTAADASRGTDCDARPVVERFLDAFNRGSLGELDTLFARAGEGWSWYSVSDKAGRRQLEQASNRRDLVPYFAGRHRQHETLRLVGLRDNGGGNFEFELVRRADDLADGKPARRIGKGRVLCEAGKLGVWSLGGRPWPTWFGRCPADAQPLAPADIPRARTTVMWFVRRVLTEIAPETNVRGARTARITLATETVRGGYAKIRCGARTQRRTAVAFVQLPAMAPSASLTSAVFYLSRTPRGWLVWFQIH